MILNLLLTLLVSLPSLLFCDLSQEDNGRIKNLIASRHYKKAIKIIELEKEKSGDSFVLLAEAYYKDQEHAKAFLSYLNALSLVKDSKTAISSKMGGEESALYEEALKIYLDPALRDPVTISLKIRDLYAGIWRLHPEYAELGYLVAIAYANLGDYTDFFEIFYRSYKEIPHHFLSYKTQGVLHIKLYDKGKTLEEKERERTELLYYFNKAKEIHPQDSSLYKMLIAFSLDKERALETNLKEIIDKDIVIPRQDLSFYIDRLFTYGKNGLATDFLAKARKWYPYSRTLDAADDILQSKKDVK